MGKLTNNYTKKSVNKKLLVSVIAVVCSILLTIGIVAAYFSDSVSQSGDITTGTLDITATYSFFVNGVEKSLAEVQNLVPGDIVVVKGNVSNVGNKSAWIRDKLTFQNAEQFLPSIEVYSGEFDKTAISGGSAASSLLTLTNGAVVTSTRIINGSGTGAETPSGGGFTYINAAAYDVNFTIYFLPTAGNETQGQSFNLTVGAQALQFTNNNDSLPDEGQWATVV